MIPAFIERLRVRRAYMRHAEAVFAAEFAIREIKRMTVRQILDADRRAHAMGHVEVIDGTIPRGQAIERRQR